MKFTEIYRSARVHAEYQRQSEYSYEQLMYGFVVQTIAALNGVNDLTWQHAIDMNPSGGLIGYGDTCPRLHKFLKHCKVCQIHAIFHDAFGFLYKNYQLGPGYDYVLGILPSCPLGGQVSGLLYWTYQYLKKQV